MKSAVAYRPSRVPSSILGFDAAAAAKLRDGNTAAAGRRLRRAGRRDTLQVRAAMDLAATRSIALKKGKPMKGEEPGLSRTA
mmetsp:Transcript_61668/g.100866  ORF Transcript_61668/g.100866 Transcript_61668/m.100866 type:complete len:82 (-) Transcript_61668:4-249(-)